MCSTHCRCAKTRLEAPPERPGDGYSFVELGRCGESLPAPSAHLERGGWSGARTLPTDSRHRRRARHTQALLALRGTGSLKKQTIARMHGQMRNRQSASNNRSNTALSYLILRSTSTSASHNMIRGFTSCVCGEVYLYLTLPYLTPLNL